MSMPSVSTPRIAAVLAFTALLVAAPLQAQSQGQGQSGASAQETPQIAEQELRSYARAYLQIADVRAQLQQKVTQASGEEEKSAVRQEANQQMATILREEGISVQRYREITSVLNADPQQRQAFSSMVQEMRAQDDDGPGGG